MKIVVNEDKELVKQIREKIKENDGHCCCAIEFNDDNLCMCKEFREQEEGECSCGLYRKVKDMDKLKIYLAGPIFTLGDKFRNDYFYKKLTEAFPEAYIYDPLQNTEINGVEGKKKFAGSQEIANGDNVRLNNTDILVACIDGDVLPSGTCAEIGKFHEKIERGDNKIIVGICTDNRQCYLTHSEAKNSGGAKELGEQQYSYQNLYVTGLIKQAGKLVSNIDDCIAYIKERLGFTLINDEISPEGRNDNE